MHSRQTPPPVRSAPAPSAAHQPAAQQPAAQQPAAQQFGAHATVHPPVSHRPGTAAPAGHGVERRPGGVTGRVSPLSRAVAAALHHLADLTGAEGRAAFVARGRIDRMLREAVECHPERGNAAAAIRVACAHLLAGDAEDAYLALLTARDMLA